jgi:hypothetical protein
MPPRFLTQDEVRLLLATQPSRMTGLTGAAGEYYVAAELSRRAWLATITIKNSPGTDVLAQHLVTGVLVAIQVKTAGPGNQFQLDAKCELGARQMNEWFVLVKLHETDRRPSFYVMPRNIVAGAVYAQHLEWLNRDRGDREVKNTSRRTLRTEHIAGYEDRWDLLDSPADEAPLLIGPWYTECVKRFGLPDGHPGWPTAHAE